VQLERLAHWIPAAAATIPLLVLSAMPPVGHAGEPMTELTRERASTFARLALKVLAKEYPNKPEHVMAGPADVLGPRALQPAFYGAYDWHSCVHGHWMLARLLRRFPDLPEAAEIRAVLGVNLTAGNLRAEADYFARQGSRPFERPYGWSWLLKLAEELHGWDDPDAKAWSENLRPLADAIVARYLEFFPKQTYPVRTGVHPNTAFGLAFAHDYARAIGDAWLEALVEERTRAYFGTDADAPARWEPSGANLNGTKLRIIPLGLMVLRRRSIYEDPPSANAPNGRKAAIQATWKF